MGLTIGYGFWIAPLGKIYHVDDHMHFIMDHPGLFKIRKGEIKEAELKDPDKRANLERYALEMGWTRVRGDSMANYNFAIWRLTHDTYFNIKMFIQKLNIPQEQEIGIKQMSMRNKMIYDKVKDIINDKILHLINPYHRRKEKK